MKAQLSINGLGKIFAKSSAVGCAVVLSLSYIVIARIVYDISDMQDIVITELSQSKVTEFFANRHHFD